MVLFVALIEVVAIYGMIIAFKVLSPVEVNVETVEVSENTNTAIVETVESNEATTDTVAE
jgi:hypothetical protein